jgi:hypothetical protein
MFAAQPASQYEKPATASDVVAMSSMQTVFQLPKN